MQQNVSQKSKQVALGGMMAALSVVLLFLTAVVPSMSMALPGLAGVLLIAVVLESGTRWALMIYAAVCILGLILCPQKDAVIYYIVFFGHYPVVKRYLERLPGRPLQWLCKLLVLNVCAAAGAALGVAFAGVQIPLSQPWVLALSWAGVNVVFVVYDFCVTALIRLYVTRLRRMFRLR